MSYTEHSFYCINCGNKGLPLMRRKSLQHKSFHRKKLYCIHCKEEINHIECKTEEDVKEFLENFKKGEYADEAKESLSYVRTSGVR